MNALPAPVITWLASGGWHPVLLAPAAVVLAALVVVVPAGRSRR